MSNSLWPHGLQHARLPCPSLSPGVCPYSCSVSQWCHSTTSSSVTPFLSCPQTFPASGSFPMSWLFALVGQSIWASASVLPTNVLGWFPLWWTGLISLQSNQHNTLIQLGYVCVCACVCVDYIGISFYFFSKRLQQF